MKWYCSHRLFVLLCIHGKHRDSINYSCSFNAWVLVQLVLLSTILMAWSALGRMTIRDSEQCLILWWWHWRMRERWYKRIYNCSLVYQLYKHFHYPQQRNSQSRLDSMTSFDRIAALYRHRSTIFPYFSTTNKRSLVYLCWSCPLGLVILILHLHLLVDKRLLVPVFSFPCAPCPCRG